MDHNKDNDVDLLWTGFGANASVEKTINILSGILLGFISDGVIQEEEKEFLKKWRIEHVHEDLVQKLRPVFAKIDDALADDVLAIEEVLEILSVVDQINPTSTNYHPETIDVQFFLGLCNGVFADDQIKPEEIRLLSTWSEQRKNLPLSPEWRDCLEKLICCLDSSGTVPSELLNNLRQFITDFIHCPTSEDANITFENKQFVLSGQFAIGPKKNVAKIIEERGGAVSSSVSQKTNYVVVGGTRSVLWKYDSYGTKVAKAKQLKEAGLPIEIVSEGSFMNAISAYQELLNEQK